MGVSTGVVLSLDKSRRSPTLAWQEEETAGPETHERDPRRLISIKLVVLGAPSDLAPGRIEIK